MYAFFFSSRRRHTRYWRDWSSDVCSSDLSSSESGEKASTKRVTTILYMIASSVDKPEGDSPVGMIAWWSVILSLSTEWRLSGVGSASPRSEEHTSELHSRPYLVFRLLL